MVISVKKEEFYKDLLDFIKTSTCSFTSCEEIEKRLKKQHFKKLYESSDWQLQPGSYYLTRNDSSIIAFQIPSDFLGYHIITSHLDTPSLQIKPISETFENGFLKLNIAPYGGLLNYSWLDRPLSIAGKVILKKDNILETHIIDFKESLLTVPSVAIHLNDKQNSKLDLNTNIDLMPIIGLKEEKNVIAKLLKEKFYWKEEDIKDFELFCYSTESPQFIGLKKDILISPRIDNLTSVYTSLIAFLEKDNSQFINVFCAFNHEEIGSMTYEGADSKFLETTLKRISETYKQNHAILLANSFVVSSDNTHAVHPNHPDLTDSSNKIYFNEGIAIAKEISSTTNAYSSSIFKEVLNHAKVKYHSVTNRNDLASGSTLAGISLSHVSVPSIDIGLGQLAMHSSYECIGKEDIYSLYKAFQVFYEVKIFKQEKSTKITF